MEYERMVSLKTTIEEKKKNFNPKFEIGEICSVKIRYQSENGEIKPNLNGNLSLCKVIDIDPLSEPHYKINVINENRVLWRAGQDLIKLEKEDKDLLTPLDDIGAL